MSTQENTDELSSRQEQIESSADLTDAVNLFRSIIKNQFDVLMEKLRTEQAHNSELIQKKVKENVFNQLKSEVNRIQYKFNEEWKKKSKKLEKIAISKSYQNAISIINEIDTRNKHIRIADSSLTGWKQS